MKHKISLCLSILLLLCACIPALAETAQPSAAPAPPSLTDRLFLLFGMDETAVLDALGQPVILETEEHRQQKTLHLHSGDDESAVSVRLIFYNGILMACEYSFDRHEAAYLYAQNCLASLETSLGEKTTYPGVTADMKGYLSELTDASQLEELFTYYEDWTPEVNEAAIRQMIGDIDYSRIDLRLELNIYPSEAAVVSMKYTVLRSSLR